jgi:acyl carrier protein
MSAISYDEALVRSLAVIEKVCRKRADEHSRFIEDLDLDSIDLIELLSEMEQEFGIRFREDQLRSLSVVGDATRCVLDQLSRRERTA